MVRGEARGKARDDARGPAGAIVSEHTSNEMRRHALARRFGGIRSATDAATKLAGASGK